ncbi:plasma-membrane choline transporter-domain-containing protein [Aspergillus desertorum]
MFVLCVALAFSWGYFLLARQFPKFFIWVTGILNIVFALGTGIYYIVRKQYGGGIVFLIFGVFAIIAFISWIPRIPFTAFMLRTSMDVSRKYGHMILVSALGGIISVAFAAWFSATLVAIYIAHEPNSTCTNPSCRNAPGSCSTARVIGLVVYVTFAMYWFSEWLKNTIRTTIAGVYGSWYYFANSPRGMPAHVTRGPLKRNNLLLWKHIFRQLDCRNHQLPSSSMFSCSAPRGSRGQSSGEHWLLDPRLLHLTP